ncbi:MAG: hypothetical protein MRY32_09415 [Rickettsiales bacterium]|nr:hypothetical protein [Rickettsiales bacterium]
MYPYSRENPSPRFTELLAMYETMHQEGDTHNEIAAEDTFKGISLAPQLTRIKECCVKHDCKTLTDYGCGKALAYQVSPINIPGAGMQPSVKEYLGLEGITLYDPGYEPYAEFPKVKSDIVVCTDVLEHCPEDDALWIAREIMSLANKCVFFNIACYPAAKFLPNGENAHCTIKPEHWWQSMLNYANRDFPDIRWYAWLDVPDEENNQMKAVSI